MSNWVPQLDKHVEIFPFNKTEYLVQHKELGYQVNINHNTFLILQLVDGHRTTEDIQQIFNKENHIQLSTDFIYDLLYRQLGQFGMIIREGSHIKHKKRASHLGLSFIFIPSKILDRITPFIAFLFGPRFFYLALGTLTVGVLTMIILNFQVIKYWLEYMKLNTLNLFLSIILFQAGNLFHELGHAGALRKFGLKSGGIGFGFYLLTPALFTDVSEAWKLDKKDRIIVNLGGIYFEMLLSGMFLLFYFYKQNISFLVIPCVLAIRTLINLNPFIKLDGYWILSDATNMPNLQNNARIVFRTKLKKLIKLNFSFSTRNEVWLFFYALLNLLVVVAFMASVFINDPYLIVKFPLHLIDLIVNFNAFEGGIFKSILIPLTFWYLLIRFIVGYLRQFVREKHIRK